MKSTRRIIGNLLFCLLVRSHRSLIRLLITACFARALCCAHSFAHSPTHSGAHGKAIFVYELNAPILYSFSPLFNASNRRSRQSWGERRVNATRNTGAEPVSWVSGFQKKCARAMKPPSKRVNIRGAPHSKRGRCKAGIFFPPFPLPQNTYTQFPSTIRL